LLVVQEIELSSFGCLVAHLALIRPLSIARQAHWVAIPAGIIRFIIVRSKPALFHTCFIEFVDDRPTLELVAPAFSAPLRLILARLAQLTAHPALHALLVYIEPSRPITAQRLIPRQTPPSGTVQYWEVGFEVTGEAPLGI
jgi:hypothetical protein